jgi:hypothetical protein
MVVLRCCITHITLRDRKRQPQCAAADGTGLHVALDPGEQCPSRASDEFEFPDHLGEVAGGERKVTHRIELPHAHVLSGRGLDHQPERLAAGGLEQISQAIDDLAVLPVLAHRVPHDQPRGPVPGETAFQVERFTAAANRQPA